MTSARFEPYAILHALEEKRVAYVIVGGLARVLQGSDELTRGLDLTPSTRKENLDRLQGALEQLNARRVDGRPLELARLEDRVLAAHKEAHWLDDVVGTGDLEPLRDVDGR
jgi:hypothetical protein